MPREMKNKGYAIFFFWGGGGGRGGGGEKIRCIMGDGQVVYMDIT